MTQKNNIDMSDFGQHVIPSYLESGERVYTYNFKGYWKDVGTIESLWEANMEYIGEENALDSRDRSWKIYSKNHIAPPNFITEDAEVKDSLVVDGSFISGKVNHSILSTNVQVRKGAEVKDSFIMSDVIIGEGARITRAIIGEGAVIGDHVVIDGSKDVQVVGYNEVVGYQMKIDKYSAILGSSIGFAEMKGLTDTRPLANLPFDGKYRLIDFQLSNLANAGVRSIYGIFRGQNIRSVFDHIRSGREWGLNSLLSHYFLGFYNTKEDSKEADKDYYQQILTYLKRSGSDQTIYMSCDILCNIELGQVIHLHNANHRNITVVYKKMPTKAISKANDILDIDETDTVVDRRSLSEGQEVEKCQQAFTSSIPHG